MSRCACWVISGTAALIGCSSPSPPPKPPTACQALTSDGGGVTVGSGDPDDPAIPRPAAFYQPGMAAVTASSFMVVTMNPLASRAGCDVLDAGGDAADAAVAVQMVLGLVEPQSSGIGGGAFAMYYDAATHTVTAYDGRETAPAAADENYLQFIDATHQTTPLPSARASGRSIGTPGALRMLELIHQDHGKAAWSALFMPAIQLASNGFHISGRLAFAISTTPDLLADAEATATYFTADHQPLLLATPLHIPAYATTLSAIASGGADALYTGALAQAIVDKIATTASASGSPTTPGLTTLADLAGYQAKRRDAICTPYRSYVVCGEPPPTSGGIAVAQTLGILGQFDLASEPPMAGPEGGRPSVASVHLIAEAERLAYADRDAYVADTDFVPLPGGSPAMLLDPQYLASRGKLIDPDHSMGTAAPGSFGASQAADHTPEHGTTQITIVDAAGNALSMTTSVESTFGSFHMTHGFILNNQLTDFSAAPRDGSGVLIANRVAAGKRPRSSMAPTLVFRALPDGSPGELVLATGSPGGATIIQYVVKALVGSLDWGLDPQQAAALVDFGAANDPMTNVGSESPELDGTNDPLVAGLRALGHVVNFTQQSSGIGTIVRQPDTSGNSVLVGGVDPRREGLVLGAIETPRP